jgi:RNA polymerase sigma-70 factor (ECF subfamily)
MDLEATLHDLAPRLLRYCVGRCQDSSLGEEAAQEALTALVARWRRHGSPDSPEAFVFTVAHRRLGRALWRRSLLLPLETLFQRRDTAPDPEERAVAKSELQETLGQLAELRDVERQALVLVAGGELDLASAAKVLGITKAALKMRVHRARKHLRELLENPT